MEPITLRAEDGYSLSLALFPAKEEAKAVIQIVHGMEEHKERYFPFAEYLAEHGFHVLTSDLRGHGKDAPLLSHIADKKGHELLISDQQRITGFLKERFPGLPIYLFGHSMGTIISRVLLQTDANQYAKVALSGYVNPNPLSGIAVFVGALSSIFHKPSGHSSLLTNLAMGPFKKAVKDAKTDVDWLSYNEANVQAYIDDPLCGEEFTVASYRALFALLHAMGKSKKYRVVIKDLPFLLIAGEDDPCTGFEKGRANSRKVLEKVGFANINTLTLAHMRHEILNENDKDSVYQYLLDFFLA